MRLNVEKLTPLLAAEWAANSAWNAAADSQVAVHGYSGWEQAPAVQAAQQVWMRAAANLAAEVRAQVEKAEPNAKIKIRGRTTC